MKTSTTPASSPAFRRFSPFPFRRFFPAAFAIALGLPGSIAVAGSQPQVLPTSGLAGFRLHNVGSRSGPSIITWSAPGRCTGEFPRTASIGVIHGGLGGGQVPADWKEVASGCEILDGSGGDVMRDNTFIYYFSEQILRKKPLGGRPEDPNAAVNLPITLPILRPDERSSALEMANGTIYWGRYVSTSGELAIYKADPAAGTGSFVTTIVGADAPIRKIRWISLGFAGPGGALAILLENGKLYRFSFDGSDLALLASSVTDFAPHVVSTVPPFTTTYLFASQGSLTPTPSPNPPAGKLLRIAAGSGAVTTVYTASGGNQIQSVAVDPGVSNSTSGHKLYIAEAPVDCFGLLCVLGNHIIRRSTSTGLTGASIPFVTILNDDAGTNLASDGTFLYYLYNGGIRRICTTASPVNFDLAALDLVVSQAVQTLSHGAVLISGRPGTVVRAYATVIADSTGSTEPYFPFATLEASVNGTPLPGSPFYPANSPQVTFENNMAALRPWIHKGFLFELPPLPVGPLELAFTLNPNQNPAETDSLANNVLTKAVPILPGRKLCLVAVPVRTGKGTFSLSHWSFPPILQRAHSLLPFSKIELRCWQPLASDSFHLSEFLSGDPFFPGGFNLDDGDQDSDCLAALDCMRKFSASPSGCPVVAWHGLIKYDITNFAGLGRRPGRSAISEMQYNPGNFDLPRGGRTIAHELGHNFGRKHIDCGDPENPDENYPYDPCTIGASLVTSAYGFDPVTQTVILPTQQGDLLSYDNPRWISDYTWNAIYFASFGSGGDAGGAPAGPPAADSPVLFAAGDYDPASNEARLSSALLRPYAHWDAARVAEDFAASEALARDPDALKIEALDAAGGTLSSTPLPLHETGDADPPGFAHFVPFPENARFVRLVKNGGTLSSKVISAHPPAVSLSPPIVDLVAGTVLLEWEASDADGDALTFLVQYSRDNGESWFAYQAGHTGLRYVLSLSELPGASDGRFRITASDGVLGGSDTSGPVEIPSHAPMASITGIQEGERVPFGSPKSLIGTGMDAEDGTEGVSLAWGGTIPATTMDTVALGVLAPGPHQAILTATDRDGMSTMATLNFEILPPTIPEGSVAPVVDGFCAEAVWSEARLIRLASAGEPRYVSLLHHSDSFYVAFANLPYGDARVFPDAKIVFDLNSNGAADIGDVGFSIDQDGVPVVLTGGRGGFTPDSDPPYGAVMAVSRGTGSWCAEMCIPDSLLGGWDQTVPVLLMARGASFPPEADFSDPATWPQVGLRSALPASPNRPPVAHAGRDEALAPQGPLTHALSGDQSFDPDGDPLTYHWTQLQGPTVVLSDPASADPTFTFPQTVGHTIFRFRLVVNDGSLDSVPDEVVIETFASATQQPSLVDVFSVSGDGFHGRFTGLVPEQQYLLRRSRTLENDWTTIDTIAADGFGALNFFDLLEPGVPSCFYQAVEAP